MPTYKLDTVNYSADGFEAKKLDISKNFKRLMLEIDMQYDTDAAVARYKDGYGSGLIDSLQIRDGGLIPWKMFGSDLWLFEQLLNKKPHGLTQLITTASQADQVVEDKYNLPVDLPNGIFSKPALEIDWGNPVNLGASGDYTIDSCSINGNYEITDLPVINTKLLPQRKGNKTSACSFDIDPEGRLAYILAITRAYAAPYALRDALTTVELKVENQYDIFDADNLKTEYSTSSGQAEATGIYLIPFSERPQVGNNSKITLNMDATATDFTLYFAYGNPSYLGENKNPDILGGQVIRGSQQRAHRSVSRYPYNRSVIKRPY